jgi:methylated-DNA-[protein]-cysteine S-methyltransferase
MLYRVTGSPIGPLLLARDVEGLKEIRFGKGSAFEVPSGWTRNDAALDDVKTQLDEYFAGERTTFDLPLAPDGTAFQKRVWALLVSIPFGRTVSYMDVANMLGSPASVRAVGTANGANPIPIVIPCHRVIGSDGSLTGYGGGLDVKRRLLEHEGALPRMLFPDSGRGVRHA